MESLDDGKFREVAWKECSKRLVSKKIAQTREQERPTGVVV